MSRLLPTEYPGLGEVDRQYSTTSAAKERRSSDLMKD